MNTILGPDPEGKIRYTKAEAFAIRLCDNCIHWKGKKKDFSCKSVTTTDKLCARFKE